MNFRLALLLFLASPLVATAQKVAPKAATVPCKATIALDFANIPDFGSLSAEKLSAIQSEITDCVLTERRLSQGDVVSAFKVQQGINNEKWKRASDLAAKFDASYNDMKNHGKDVADLLIKVNASNKDLVQQYNKLVDRYNSLLDGYKSNAAENARFAERMRDILRAQAVECNDAIRDAIQSLPVSTIPAYKPAQQTHCTAHTISNPVTGNWTYMDCN